MHFKFDTFLLNTFQRLYLFTIPLHLHWLGKHIYYQKYLLNHSNDCAPVISMVKIPMTILLNIAGSLLRRVEPVKAPKVDRHHIEPLKLGKG